MQTSEACKTPLLKKGGVRRFGRGVVLGVFFTALVNEIYNHPVPSGHPSFFKEGNFYLWILS